MPTPSPQDASPEQRLRAHRIRYVLAIPLTMVSAWGALMFGLFLYFQLKSVWRFDITVVWLTLVVFVFGLGAVWSFAMLRRHGRAVRAIKGQES